MQRLEVVNVSERIRPMASGYSEAGASKDRRSMKGFTARSSSPNEDINWNQYTLRQRGRMLFMSSPVARSSIETNKVKVVGTGLTPKPVLDLDLLHLTPEAAKKWQRNTERAHSKDAETGDATTPVDDILDSFEELKTADNATQAQMIMYSKLFKINFTKMDPYEFKTFTDILQRYSDLCKPVKGTGRGKKKK